ncbi:hypothetical protein GUITHDRAFT_155290 [Guillardia theta CCMP2712]|uniref:Uncharacterized protein n=1 Tax=Guillardia theta (strain CCMP2712) TaxID=905079 RepID=L1IJW9_GUITC|nr:hypothetical protein GUITHDRAFT_155290 [Guillardia theta CCMP2712]EKX36219.1 hypothetical protein GUITHDRAFT_155290 [Guillardia theta CCMP2712]|eukprot:XP_005823199.1 hypothetical protein GUITHDRAFT_155290 [Guillardia theta CCMP2712]
MASMQGHQRLLLLLLLVVGCSFDFSMAKKRENEDMKTIDAMLRRIHGLTRGIKSHTKKAHSYSKQIEGAKHRVRAARVSTKNAQIRHHVNKALQEAENAEKALKNSDKKKRSQSSLQDDAKRKMIAQKMKMLQKQISDDFSSVTAFGNKAGYLPPIKMPKI